MIYLILSMRLGPDHSVDSHDGPVLALHLPKHPVRDLEVERAVAADDSVDDESPDIQAEIEGGTGCSRHAERKNLAVDVVVVVDPRDPCSLRRRSFARSWEFPRWFPPWQTFL
jgi:hypothetical protein